MRDKLHHRIAAVSCKRFQMGNAPPRLERLPLRKKETRFDLAGFGDDS